MQRELTGKRMLGSKGVDIWLNRWLIKLIRVHVGSEWL